MKRMSWKQLLAIAAVVALAFAVGLVVAGRTNHDDTAASASPPASDVAASSSTTASPGSTDLGAPNGIVQTPNGGGLGDGSASGAGALDVVEPATPVEYAYTEPDTAQKNGDTIPPTPQVQVSMSSTQNLHDGDPITIRVTPTPGSGSKIYGFDARVCVKDAPIKNMYDYFPTVSGLCAVDPLSPSSDAHIQVAGTPPYEAVDMTFRAGTGSNSFTTDRDTGATVRCDSGHPCDLVLWIQVPYGFLFEHFPLTFA